MGNEAVRNLIREGKSRQLRNVVATGAGDGMQTIEMDLARLVSAGLVSMEVAQSISAYPGEIQSQVATLRSQAQAAATSAAGQVGTSGSAQPSGANGSNGSNGGASSSSASAPPPPQPAPTK